MLKSFLLKALQLVVLIILFVHVTLGSALAQQESQFPNTPLSPSPSIERSREVQPTRTEQPPDRQKSDTSSH